jgi:uncharacterized coiled-coil protein SlyX
VYAPIKTCLIQGFPQEFLIVWIIIYDQQGLPKGTHIHSQQGHTSLHQIGWRGHRHSAQKELPMDLERRVEELETRYAFQEENLRQLDEVVQECARMIDMLRHENRELRAQLAQRPEDTPNKIEDEVPPHY